MRSRLPLALLLGVALFAAACDGSGPPEKDALFRVEVTDADGAPVEELRVGVRPCFGASCDPGDVFSVPPSARAAAQPVELDGTLTATLEDRDVLLAWRTTSEQRNEGFTVQRRSQEEDDFTSIGFTEGAGTTGEAQSYRFRDSSPPPGTYVYQLVQKGVDGTAKPYEDETATATVPVDGEYALEGPYPHPFTSRATFALTLPEAQQVTATVQTLAGRRVTTLFDDALGAGPHRFGYEPAPDMPDGLYRVVFEGETFADTTYALLTRSEDPVYRPLGATGASGTFSTDARAPFPVLFDPPALERRAPNNEMMGEFSVGSAVEIALTDPATGRRQTYRRTVRPGGTNTFSLDWTP